MCPLRCWETCRSLSLWYLSSSGVTSPSSMMTRLPPALRPRGGLSWRRPSRQWVNHSAPHLHLLLCSPSPLPPPPPSFPSSFFSSAEVPIDHEAAALTDDCAPQCSVECTTGHCLPTGLERCPPLPPSIQAGKAAGHTVQAQVGCLSAPPCLLLASEVIGMLYEGDEGLLELNKKAKLACFTGVRPWTHSGMCSQPLTHLHSTM